MMNTSVNVNYCIFEDDDSLRAYADVLFLVFSLVPKQVGD